MRSELGRFLRLLQLRSEARVHIKVRGGEFHLVGVGAWYSYWRDPYHLMLTIPWVGFLGIIVLFYIIVNSLFALAYLAGGDCIQNAATGSFLDAFFFSVQTLATIGYGSMYPKTPYANTVVMVEAMASLVGIALLTGLAFARFSRPTARVLFSRVAVVTMHEGCPTLIFRTANQRRNQILEAQMRVYLMRDEVTVEGQYIRRIYDLELLRNHSPSFTLTWSIMHKINQSSPLYNFTKESLTQTRSTIVVSLSGIDETVSQVLHARYNYLPRDIICNSRFVDIIHHTEEGHRYIEYKHFHNVERDVEDHINVA